ncbi:MAG: hypothetical protein NZT92_03315 [Abditibacteriales bacterium]|nr:hypothetical protein [Abditibacteriales bacterium]MDW8365830.1 hypothetical protein [Abditibacteriales bacterium]
MRESRSSSVNGTLILVLGILSVVSCSILGPVAWIMGNNALTTLNQGGGSESERGLVVAGRILGIIGTVLLVLGILWAVFFGGLTMLAVLAGGGR